MPVEHRWEKYVELKGNYIHKPTNFSQRFSVVFLKPATYGNANQTKYQQKIDRAFVL